MVEAERHMKAMEKINALISVRERSCQETRARLAKSGFSDEEIEDAVSTAVRCGLIDESRFTRAFIRGKTSLGWGRAKILQRLEAEHIPQDIIDSCSDEFASPEDEYERALHDLKRKPSRSADPYASYVRRLVGKGYSYEIARRAAAECLGR